jgi:hypothetical protein
MEYGATAHNRIVCAAPPTAAWPTKTAVGAAPLCAFFSGTFCPPLKPLRGFFIAAVKTSHTTGTLCAMPPKLVGKIME